MERYDVLVAGVDRRETKGQIESSAALAALSMADGKRPQSPAAIFPPRLQHVALPAQRRRPIREPPHHAGTFLGTQTAIFHVYASFQLSDFGFT